MLKATTGRGFDRFRRISCTPLIIKHRTRSDSEGEEQPGGGGRAPRLREREREREIKR
jgi:hypothetical protein